MLDKLSAKIADYLTTDDDSEWELVKYSATMLISRLTIELIILIVAIFTHMWIEALIILIGMNLFRKQYSGWHAQQFWLCFLVSVAIFIIIMAIGRSLMAQSGLVAQVFYGCCLFIMLLSYKLITKKAWLKTLVIFVVMGIMCLWPDNFLLKNIVIYLGLTFISSFLLFISRVISEQINLKNN